MTRRGLLYALVAGLAFYAVGYRVHGETKLLEFSASWCEPCRAMAPIVAKLQREGLPIETHDFDSERALAQQLGVKEIPAFIAIDDGREIGRQVGVIGEPALRALVVARPRIESQRSASVAAVRVWGVEKVVGNMTHAQAGSGALIDIDGDYGYVITNCHVVAGVIEQPTVTFPDGWQSKGQIVSKDKDLDLALLRIWKPNYRPIEVSDKAPKIGDRVTLHGYGASKDREQFRQIPAQVVQYVSNAPTEPGGQLGYENLVLSAASRDGDSGGPVLDESGKLVGVNWGSDRTKVVSGPSGAHAVHCGCVLQFLQKVLPRNRKRQQSKQPAQPHSVVRVDPPQPGSPGWTQPSWQPSSPAGVSVAIGKRPLVEVNTPVTAPATQDRLSLLEQIEELKGHLRRGDREHADRIAELHAKLQAAEQRAAELLGQEASSDASSPADTPIDHAAKAVATTGLTAILGPYLGPAAPYVATAAVGVAGGVFAGMKLRGRKRLKAVINRGGLARPVEVNDQATSKIDDVARRFDGLKASLDAVSGRLNQSAPPLSVVGADPIVVNHDAEPAPQIVQRAREFVRVEVPSVTLDALQWAMDTYVRKHPGAESVVTTIENIASQYESGLRKRRGAAG